MDRDTERGLVEQLFVPPWLRHNKEVVTAGWFVVTLAGKVGWRARQLFSTSSQTNYPSDIDQFTHDVLLGFVCEHCQGRPSVTCCGIFSKEK